MNVWGFVFVGLLVLFVGIFLALYFSSGEETGDYSDEWIFGDDEYWAKPSHRADRDPEVEISDSYYDRH